MEILKDLMFHGTKVLEEVVKNFIRLHQGEKGYIDTHVKEDGATDNIWTYKFCSDGSLDIMFPCEVIAVRVKNDTLQILPNTDKINLNEPGEVFDANDSTWDPDWFAFGDGDYLCYETLGSIAESIEQYV